MKKRFVLLISILMTFVLLLSSCGSSKNATDGDTQNTSGEKELNLRSNIQIQTVDPSETRIEQNMVMLEQIYEGLYKLNEKEGAYELGLAENEVISEDGLVYTFTLKDNVKFHNGETLQSDDVIFSFDKYITNPKFNAYTNMIVSVENPDEKTVVVTLDKPYSPISHSFHTMKVLSKKEVEKLGSTFGTIASLAGTGPFMITSYDSSTKLALKAFPDYWKGEANIKLLNYIPIEDDAAALVAFENGEIDWMNIPLADWANIESNDKYNKEIIPGNWTQYLGINYQKNEILGNDLVRQAIGHALNKEDMNIATFEGYGTPTDYYMPVEYVAATPTEFTKYDYNTKKAKALLTEAGYPGGVNVGEILAYGATGEKSAQVIQENLRLVGIESTVSILDSGIAVDRMNAQEYDLCIANDMGNFDFNNFRQQADSRSRGMYMVKFEGDKFDYKHFDELCDQGAALSDIEERKAIYTELYDAVMKTATIFPLLHSPVANAWVKDLEVVNTPTYYNVYDWKWVE